MWFNHFFSFSHFILFGVPPNHERHLCSSQWCHNGPCHWIVKLIIIFATEYLRAHTHTNTQFEARWKINPTRIKSLLHWSFMMLFLRVQWNASGIPRDRCKVPQSRGISLSSLYFHFSQSRHFLALHREDKVTRIFFSFSFSFSFGRGDKNENSWHYDAFMDLVTCPYFLIMITVEKVCVLYKRVGGFFFSLRLHKQFSSTCINI